MEMQKREEVKTTTNYWGYRELSANEVQEVGGGGDFSGDGFGGNTGYGTSSYTSYTASQSSNSSGMTGFASWLTRALRSIYSKPSGNGGTYTTGVRG
jgi:hypothetical protein